MKIRRYKTTKPASKMQLNALLRQVWQLIFKKILKQRIKYPLQDELYIVLFYQEQKT